MAGIWRRYRSMPKWAQIIIGVVVAFFAIGIIGNIAGAGKKSKVAATVATTAKATTPPIPTTTTRPKTTTTMSTAAALAGICGPKGCKGKPTKPTPETFAKSTVNVKLDADVQLVQNNVEIAIDAVAVDQKNPSQTGVDQIATSAQQAHDALKGLENQIENDGNFSDASGAVSAACDDVANSMGALVAYTGNPNPATLAHFSSQYDTGVSEWNNAVDALYAGTTQTPPTIPTS